MESEMALLIPILSVIGLFSFLIISSYLSITSQHKQRLALIEHGKDASIFRELKSKDRSKSLKHGMLAVGVGLGVLIGYIIGELGIPEPMNYFAMMLISGGGGLILFYRNASTADDDKLV